MDHVQGAKRELKSDPDALAGCTAVCGSGRDNDGYLFETTCLTRVRVCGTDWYSARRRRAMRWASTATACNQNVRKT